MQDFWVFFKIGLGHVLDINGYDHVLFLIALTVPYLVKDWKRILVLVTVFTLGHSMALVLSVFNFVNVNVDLVEFVIPITIFLTAFYNLIHAGKPIPKENLNFISITTLFFGIIHGLGFSNYFKTILFGEAIDKLPHLFEFAVGIEAAQICVVLVVLLVSFVVQTLFKFSKRDFALTASAFVIGVVVPIIIENPIWKK
jgi:hypothetical protein